MGCDCLIKLPGDVRLRDVANVLGLLAGCESVTIASDHGTEYKRLPSVEVKSSHDMLPECARIVITRNIETKDGDTAYVLYHFEPSDANGETYGRLLMPPSTAWWIAAGRRLVDFFGGEVVSNDCADRPTRYVRRKPRRRNNPEGGAAWRKLYAEIWAVAPVTQAEVDDARTVAVYK